MKTGKIAFLSDDSLGRKKRFQESKSWE